MDIKRQKRDLINGAVTLFKTIPGNLDDTDVKLFTDSINRLNNNHLEVKTFLENQITVISSVIRTPNERIHKISN